ncbi:hypothetical protein GCM10011409_25280 [Lentibacillus populi]|uniref:Addiction module toxin RelE n=1 Tax=Lentibacillus populi TaxID=1827502 RepID=A0A9W5TY40_9BACI|nr:MULTISPECIES: hypothetical protein [Bacillaceae]GGB46711.1 hypothetical protein GCM10011409_25280 [Lentibacillus populi]
MREIEKIKQYVLQSYNVDIRFSRSAAQDIKKIKKGNRSIVLLEIVRRAKNGPLIKPRGIGEPLRAPLNKFVKLKLRALNIRIIYRPTESDSGVIKMEIIAIGPRDKNKVYQLAAERLLNFAEEMEKNND